MRTSSVVREMPTSVSLPSSSLYPSETILPQSSRAYALSNPKFHVFPPRPSKKLHHNHSKPHKGCKMAMFNRQAYWTFVEADIDAHLVRVLPASPPAAVSRPMRHLVSAAPRTLAPALCVAACELVGGSRAHAMDVACGLRIMLAGACAHDRLPALLGGGGTTYPAGVELLTGQGLLTLGYELAARSTIIDPVLALRVVVEIAELMGTQGMVEEQWLRVEGGEEERVGEGAEGRLCACGAACGAILGGAGEEVVERLRRCGQYTGMVHGLLHVEGRGDVGRQEKVEAARRFGSLAKQELEGLEERKANVILGLFDLWWSKDGIVL